MSTMPMGGYADYDLENQQLERRRKIAEMLSMQSGGPFPTGQMVGNVYVPTHWTQHAAKVLNGYAADKQLDRIDQRQMDNTRRKSEEIAGEGRKFGELLKGTPATTATHTADDQMAYGGAQGDSTTTQVQTPGVAGNRDAAMSFAMGAKDPTLRQAALAQMLAAPEGQFAKLNPKDYTPESLRKFAASGGKDFSLLENRKNLHFADIGNGIVGLNPENGMPSTPTFTKGMTPDAYANLLQKQHQFDNLSAADRQRIEMEAKRLGISAQQHFFETGMQAPGGAPLPPNAPTPQFGVPPQGMPQPGMNVPQRQAMQVPPQVQQGRDSDRLRILQEEAQANPNDPALQAELRNAQSGQNYAGLGAGRAPVALPSGVTPKGMAQAAEKQLEARNVAAQQLPQVIATANQAIQNIDDMIGDMDRGGKKPPHPGFGQAVGVGLPGLKYVPGTDTADFSKRLDQVKGGAFLQAFESLKGGGQITEIEGAKATAALNRMDAAQSEKEFVTAAREYQGIMRSAVERAKGKAGTPNMAAGKIRVYNPATGRIE